MALSSAPALMLLGNVLADLLKRAPFEDYVYLFQSESFGTLGLRYPSYMRFLTCLALWSLALACDSKKLVAIPPILPDGGAGGEAGADGRGGSGGGNAGAGGEGGGEGGAAGEPEGGRRFSFVGKAYTDVPVAGAGGDGGGGAPGEGGSAGEGGAGAIDLPPLTRIECDFFGNLVDAEPNDQGGYTGFVEGELFRQLLSRQDPNDEWILLFEFQALLGGPGEFTADADGNIELRIAGEQPAEAPPFWQELEVLSGTESSADHYGGAWTCASMMFANDVGPPEVPEVPGTWTLEPVE